MPDKAINTQGGPVFEGDHEGTYIGGDQIIALQGYTVKDLNSVLDALQKALATGQAVLQANLAHRRLLVTEPDSPAIILSEQAALDLLPIAAARGDEADYLAALVINPRYGNWSSQYVELSGSLTEVIRPLGWQDALKPDYILYEMKAGEARKQIRRVPLDDITQAMDRHPALILLGEPGSGKTTTLERLVLEAALNRSAARPSKLPLLLPLADYRQAASPYDFVHNLWQRHLGNIDLRDKLQAGEVLLLFDALNEMPFSDLREYRRKVHDLRRFALVEWPGNQVVFTCRSRDYSEPLGLPQVEIERLNYERIQRFLKKRLEDDLVNLTWNKLSLLVKVRNPYYLNILAYQVSAGGQWPESRASLFKGFIGQLMKWERLHALPGWAGERPLESALVKLAAAMQAQGEGTRLARSEAERILAAPDEILDKLIDNEAGSEQGLAPGLAIELGLGATLLDIELGEDEQEQVRFFHHQLQEYMAAQALLARYQSGQEMRPYWRQPRLKQEMPASGPLKDFEPLPLPPQTGWEEPTLLAAGLASEPGYKVDLREFLERLRALNPVLAAHCMMEPGLANNIDLQDATRRALLQEMVDGRNHRRARLAAGLALGSLGDPRFPVVDIEGARVRLPPLVYVPGGRNMIGSPDWQVFWMKCLGWPVKDEAPRHAVDLAPFWIGQYPVTNGEYRCFIDDGGYENESYWRTEAARAWRSGEAHAEGSAQEWMGFYKFGHDKPDRVLEQLRSSGIPPDRIAIFEKLFKMDDDQVSGLFQERFGDRDRSYPAYWEDERYNNPIQPVVGLTWYEAQAYCNWLEEKLNEQLEQPEPFAGWSGASQLNERQLGERLVVRLPSEPEWEAAARGASRQAYPWGNRFDEDYANTVEGGLNRSSPVGMYPDGASRSGLHDLSGNVWEWTQSLYKKYPCWPRDKRDDLEAAGRRVVRGGSWLDFRTGARCAARDWDIPSAFCDSLGFRVVLSLAPSEP